jgi:hypothetical protein
VNQIISSTVSHGAAVLRKMFLPTSVFSRLPPSPRRPRCALTYSHGGTWPWDGLQPSVAHPAPVVRSGSTQGPLGDGRARSCDMDNIALARVQAVCDPCPSSRGHRGLSSVNLETIPTGCYSTQNPSSLGFVAAADPRSCSSFSESSIKLGWFDHAWGGRW